MFVNRYTVNIIYWDQWDFLQGLFDGADTWTLFRQQHGPQRQGLGNLIVAVLYPATGWNGRADAAATAVLMVLAALAGLWLVKRVCGSLRPWDLVVPLIFLTTSSAETYVVAPNLAHGPLPALLLTTYALALTIPSHSARCASLVVLNFLCCEHRLHAPAGSHHAGPHAGAGVRTAGDRSRTGVVRRGHRLVHRHARALLPRIHPELGDRLFSIPARTSVGVRAVHRLRAGSPVRRLKRSTPRGHSSSGPASH